MRGEKRNGKTIPGLKNRPCICPSFHDHPMLRSISFGIYRRTALSAPLVIDDEWVILLKRNMRSYEIGFAGILILMLCNGLNSGLVIRK